MTTATVAQTAAGHIVALGGGGFSMRRAFTGIDNFVLSLAGRTRPRVCFIPTASADSAQYIARFYRAFSSRCVPTDLTFFDPPALPRQPTLTSDLADFVAAQDVFYVGGGNTAHLLAIWRLHGLDRLLRDAWMRGAVLAGISAGMICWFQAGVTDSFGGLEALPDGLGLLPGSACPHYDGEPGRRGRYHELVSAGLPAGYAADDDAALHFTGTGLTEVVADRPKATAYRVEREGGEVVETPLPARLLTATF
jgi:dipeptidase E